MTTGPVLSRGHSAAQNASVLVVDGLRKRYGGIAALDGVSLAVGRGEIVALLGPSGCGKTTTLRLLTGFEQPDAGTITIAGRPVAGAGHWVPPERRGIGMVFQEHALFPHLRVVENVAFGLRGLSRGARTARVAEVLDFVELGGCARRYPHELSGGQRQRVALARALAPQPTVILFDEPFSSLDADLRVALRAEVRAILRDCHATAIFVTHDQEEAFAIADRIAVLHRGRIVQCGTAEELYDRPTDRFVADFIGQADFVPGTVRGATIETELGPVLNWQSLPNGAAVEVMVRPERLNMQPNPQGYGQIAERVFRGRELVYSVCLASGRRVHSVQPPDVAFAPGDRVAVTLSNLPTPAFRV